MDKKSILFLLISLLFVLSKTNANQNTVDSLLALIKTSNHETPTVNLYGKLSSAYLYINADSAKIAAQNQYELSRKINYPFGIASGLYSIAKIYKVDAKYDTAITIYKQAAQQYIDLKDNNGTAKALSEIGLAFSLIGQSDSCIKYNSDALKYISEKDDANICMFIYRHLGRAYYQKVDYNQSLQYYIKAIKLAEQLGHNQILGDANMGIGSNYSGMGDNDKCIEYMKKAITYYRKIPGDIEDVMAAEINISTAYLEQKNWDSCMRYANMALGLSSKDIEFYNCYIFYNQAKVLYEKEIYLMAFSLADSGLIVAKKYEDNEAAEQLFLIKGKINYKLEQYDLALEDLKSATNLLSGTTQPELEISKTFSLVYEAKGDFKSALFYQRRYSQLADSTFNNDKVKSITLLQTKYETEKKEHEIKILAKENETKTAVAERENQKKNFAYIGIIALLLLGLYIFTLYSKRTKLSNQLSQSLSDLKQTQNKLIQTEKEKEAENIRLRISRDIHDELGSNLTKIALLSDMIATSADKNSQASMGNLQRISTYSRDVNTALSEIVWAISPKQDTLESLLIYMRAHIHKFFENMGVVYEINFPETFENRNINPDLKRNIFLVLKESLNNILKYAHAKFIVIELKTDDDNFELRIKDDGVGFGASENAHRGNGLNNMNFRMLQSGCVLKIISSQEQGCEIHATGKLF